MTIDGVVVGSLGCVDDATDAYRRLTEAAIADEWLATLPKVTDAQIYALRVLDVFGPLIVRSGQVWTADGADFSPSVIQPSDLTALPPALCASARTNVPIPAPVPGVLFRDTFSATTAGRAFIA
jgi:hypothetical protein